MVALDTEECIMISAAVVVSISALLLVWGKYLLGKDGFNRNMELVVEVVLEAGLLTLIVLNIIHFAEDTALLRRRLKVAVALIYISALVSTLGFIVSTSAYLARPAGDPLVRRTARTTSRFAWTLYLIISVVAFIAYLTVSDETDALAGGTGEGIIFGLITLPAGISLLIIGWHLLWCLRGGCKWPNTKYYPRFMKAMVTIFALLLAGTPLLKYSEGKSNEETTFKEGVAVSSEILAAFLHRVSLESLREEESVCASHDPESATKRSHVQTVPAN